MKLPELKKALQQHGLKPEGGGFLLRQGRPPPPTLMPFARLLVLQVRG